MITMKIESTKGNTRGTEAECVRWLEEYQPSHASIVIAGYTATVDSRYDGWADGVRAAIVEITEEADIDGGEENWQHYLSTDALIELIVNQN